MQNPPQPPKRVPIWRRRLLLLAALALLAGCAANGDFGEVRPSLVSDDIHNWLGSAGRPTSPSSFDLTDDERQLRDLGYPLIEPPQDRQRWYSLAAEYGVIQRAGLDRSAYTSDLLSSRYRSPSARYSQLNDDIRDDVTRITPFFETAGRVLDLDQKRQRSLAYISDISAIERDHAQRRMRENISIVSQVRASLARRVTAYRFALEHLVVRTPSPQAVEAERSLNSLRAEIARYRNQTAPTWVREPSLASAR
jgi:hypothetical protein